MLAGIASLLLIGFLLRRVIPGGRRASSSDAEISAYDKLMRLKGTGPFAPPPTRDP